jgi:hypothetical protein
MADSDYAWADEIMAQFNKDFNPSTTSFIKIDQLSDGEYGVYITKAELTQLQSTGEPIYRITFRIEEGPSHVNSLVEKVTFFRNQVSVNILGAELKLLGIPTDQWQQRGISLARGFSESSPALVNLGATIRKRTSQAKDGKTYHNINITGLRQRNVGDAAEPDTVDDNPFAG